MTEQLKVGSTELNLPPIEVGGFPVRCIASNFRVKDAIDWQSLKPVAGIGHEGGIVLATIDSIDARKEMEYLLGSQISDVELAVGDNIVGVLANRHSGTSEYGEVPTQGIEILPGTELDLLAAGGVIGKCFGVPKTLGHGPTKVKAIGLLSHQDGRPADLRDFYPLWDESLQKSAPIILSLGTAAEIGKTTTATKLIEGFRNLGIQRIAASKLAGTGRKRDIAFLARAGASPAYDFPDIGLATTYTSQDRYVPATYTLLNKINSEGDPDIIIAECGGDIIEGNIPTLLQDQNVMRNVTAIIHGSTDVLSIMGSLAVYERFGIRGKITIFLTYPIRRNYFAIKERLREQGINLPIFDPMNPQETSAMVRQILH